MATVIGTVSNVTGMAIVVDGQGNRHQIKPGEVLSVGDRVITAAGAVVTIKMITGEVVNFREAQTIKVTEALAETGAVDPTENIVNQAIIQALLTAINEGRDINEILDDPAAGAGGSEGNTTFINLDRLLTSDADRNVLDGGRSNPLGVGDGEQNRNLIYFPPVTDAPGVVLLGDQNNDGFINASEAGGRSDTSVEITLPGGVFSGDALNLTVNGVTRQIIISAADIAAGKMTISVPLPTSGTALQVSATITNQSGLTSAPGSDSAIVDIDVPNGGTAPTVEITEDANNDGYINLKETQGNADVKISFDGSKVSIGDKLVITSSNGESRTIVIDATAKTNGFVTTSFTPQADGTVMVTTAYIIDDAGNQSATGQDSATIATSPPAIGISLDAGVAGDGIVNINESKAASIAVTGTVSGQYKVGDIVTLTVNGKTFTGSVIAGGRFSIDVPGADLAADADRIVEASVTTTDVAGNVSTAVDTQNYTVNLTPPALAISLDANVAGDGIVNINESKAATIAVTGTVSGQFNVGDIVTVKVNNKTFTGTVQAGGTFSVNVTGADLAADADRIIEASVTTTDAVGNSNTASDTQNYTVDLNPPALAISLDANVAGDGIINIAESKQAKTLVTGTVSGQFNVGDKVVVTLNDKQYSGVVQTGGKFAIEVDTADMLADKDRTIDASVSTTNAAGNSNIATDTQTYTVNLNPPALAISLDANVAGDGIVNLAESQAANIAVTGTVSGQFNIGDTVTLTVNGKTFTGTVSAGGKFSINVPGADLAADADRTIEASVTTTDAVGNTNTAKDTQDYRLDTDPPKATIALDANFAGDGMINLNESTAAQIAVTGTVGGDVKLDDEVVVTINGKDYKTTVITRADGKLGFAVNVSGAELAADPDRTIDARVTTTDSAGNTISNNTSLTYVVDTTPPEPTIALDANFGGDGIINLQESNAAAIPVSGTVGGDAKEGDKVVVTVNGKDYETTVVKLANGKLGFSVNVPGAELTADADHTIDAKVTSTDLAGNSATVSTALTYTVDTTPPVPTIALDANFAGDGIINLAESTAAGIAVSGTVGGDAKEGDKVVVTVNGKDYETTVVKLANGKLGFSVSVPGSELAADADKTIEAKVSSTDQAGNSATVETALSYTLDTDPPKPTIALDANFTGDGIINLAESGAAAIPISGTVGGDAKEGDKVVVIVNGKDYETTVVKLANGKLGFSVNVPGAELTADADHTIDANVSSTDTSGNPGKGFTSLTYTVDLVAPAKPTIDSLLDDVGTVTGNVPNGGTADDARPTLSGKAEAGSTVTLYDGNTIIGTTTADKDGRWTFTPASDIAKGPHSYTVTATDVAGNTSVKSDPYAYTYANGPTFGNPDDATAVVSEEGLKGGLPDATGVSDKTNLTTFSGDMKITDPDGDPVTVTLTAPTNDYFSHGVKIVWTSANNGHTLIGSANGAEVVRVSMDNAGKYTVTLSGAVDHPVKGQGAAGEDSLSIKFTVTANDGTATTTSTMTVNIEDDAPVAQNQTVTTNGSTGTNVLLTIDVSGSMAAKDQASGLTQLQREIISINQLLDNYATLGDVRVMIVTFASASHQLTPTWVTVAEAKQILANLVTLAGSDYQRALEGSMEAFDDSGKLAGAQNVGYFFSDGRPNSSSGLTAADQAAWEQFLRDNDIKEYAIGVGSASDAQIASSMNGIAYDGQKDKDTNAVHVTSFAQLDSFINTTSAAPVSGNLTTGGGFGADGGYVLSLLIDGTTYTFNVKDGSITINGTNRSSYNASTHQLTITTSNGTLVVDMDNGEYTFTPSATTGSGLTSSNVSYTLSDYDGDTSSATATFNVSKSTPQVAPTVSASTSSGGLLSLGNLLNVDLLNFSSRQSFTASDPNNDITKVTIDYSALLNVTVGSNFITFDQTLADELGLKIVYTNQSGLLGLIGGSGRLVITAKDGGTIDNLAMNEFLATIRVNDQPVDVSLFQNFTITATDSQGNVVSASDGTVINADVLSTGSGGNTYIGGDAGDNALNGTANEDLLYGFAGNDTIHAQAGNDLIRGGAGSDVLFGDAGNDILIGGAGNDTLTGGEGTDIFKWDRNDNGVAGQPAKDIITDFSMNAVNNGGDVLDIRDLLQGETFATLQNYLHFAKSGNDTIIYISANGGFAGDAHLTSGQFNSGNTTQQIVLTGVDLTSGQSSDAAIIASLAAQQKLVTD